MFDTKERRRGIGDYPADGSFVESTIVPAGAYRISARSNGILEAHLGACVGIAAVDRSANLGGLYHILLPHAPDPDGGGDPALFAESGLPRFLDELRRRGADFERMDVTLAGGAFVTPISTRELELDLGGRTMEVVVGILKERGIRVERSEAAGYFSCRLSLDLRSLDARIEPICDRTEPVGGVHRTPLSPDELDRAIMRVRPIPQVALKIIRMLGKSTTGMDEIADEIGRDQVLSAKAIALSNSAFIGARGRIDSIDQALMMLGEKLLKRLVLSASLEVFYQNAGTGYSLCKGGMFHHAVGTGIVAAELAERGGALSPETAYTAGLLHDVGKAVLDQYVASAFPLFYRKVHHEGQPLIEVERSTFGVDHAEAGGRLAELWDFPKNLTAVLKHHHLPDAAETEQELVYAVYLADFIMSRYRVATELDRLSAGGLGRALNLLGIDSASYADVVAKIPWDSFDASNM